MARLHGVLSGTSGTIGKQVVFKRYGTKTIVTQYPNMRHTKPTKLQELRREQFAEAVAYAQSINRDPVKKAAYKKKVKRGHTVYHYALKEYLEKLKKEEK